jgi:hypothetical protein
MNEQMTAFRQFTVFGIIGEAWRLTKGAKWALLAPLICMIVVELVGLAVILGAMVFVHGMQTKPSTGVIVLCGLAFSFAIIYVFTGLLAGVVKTAIERGRGKTVSGTSGFHSFSRVAPVMLTFLLFMLCLAPQFLLRLIPGLNGTETTTLVIVFILQTIYGIVVTPLLYLCVPLAVDKTDSAFTAIADSVKVSLPHWLKLIGIFLVMELLMITAWFIPMGISVFAHNHFISILAIIFLLVTYVWIIPFMFVVQGVLYHKLID